MPRPF